jgi:hypothetical protein
MSVRAILVNTKNMSHCSPSRTKRCSGNIYVAGIVGSNGGTYPVNFPTTSGAVQTAYGGGTDDAFVAEISAVVSAGAMPAASIASAADSRSLASITGNIDPQGIADPPPADMFLATAAVSSTSKSQDMAALSSTSVPSSGSPTPTADQLFANFALILSDAGNAHQLGMFSMPALWQSVDALAVQRLDALLSLEAGAMGITKDLLMRDFLFANMATPIG